MPVLRGGRARLAIVTVALALLASACSVDAMVEVRVREDGSGVVRLTVVADAEAVRAVESGGAQLDQAVRLSDLTDAGWEVEPWTRADDGSATLVLRNPFRNVSEVAAIFRDVSGNIGPLRDLRATRDRKLVSTEYGLAGRADLENVQTGVPADEALVQSLAAQGVDVNVIDQQLLAQLQASFSLEIVARLPGSRPTTITAKPGEITRVNATSSVRDTQRIAFLGGAAVLLLLAIVLWIRGGRRRRRRPARPRRPTPPPRGRARPALPRAPMPPSGLGRPGMDAPPRPRPGPPRRRRPPRLPPPPTPPR